MIGASRRVSIGIRGRLLLVVVSTTLLFAAAVVGVLVALGQVAASYRDLLDVDERLLLDATRFRVLAEREVSLEQTLVTSGDLEGLRAIDAEQNFLVDDLAVRATSPDDRARLERIRTTNSVYDSAIVAAAELAAAGDAAGAAAALATSVVPARGAFIDAADAFIEAETTERDAARQLTTTRLYAAGTVLVVALLVGGTLAAVISLALGGRIARGVVATAGAVRRLAAGDLGVDVPPQSVGELRDLAADVETLRATLMDSRRRVQLLRDTSRALLTSASLGDAVAALAARTAEASGAERVVAVLIDERTGRVVEEGGHGREVAGPPDACVPIASHDGALRGELRVWAPSGRAWRGEDADLLEALAAEAGLALRNAALADAAHRRVEELDALVHVVVHDIGGPMSVAQRVVEVIRARDPALARAQEPLFARAGDAMAYAESLIDDLRELSRAGRLSTLREPVSLGEVASEVATSLEAVLTDRKIALEVRDGGAVLQASRRELRQILTNLVENAARHMGEPDAPRVAVVAEPSDQWWRVGVVDNGRGIPPDQRAAAFLPFRRLGGEAQIEPGTGLGLAIARRIVEAHGGLIWIDEAPGGGCAVYLTLPRADDRCPAV